MLDVFNVHISGQAALWSHILVFDHNVRSRNSKNAAIYSARFSAQFGNDVLIPFPIFILMPNAT
jgi:hypothetical protein